MKSSKDQCPRCGSYEIGKGKQAGDAAVIPLNKLFAFGSAIFHRICTNCGYVIDSFVENPSKFKG
ncbi:transcription initiation factor TFIIIB [Brevibacillus sp. SYSU BS000544]|uniref:transcription initiation factor TFIIIB n=1 Tax=Brevibacillus sp. SYSU BS000544 TaxID=3416443 RepID=UPI003CE572FB